MRANRRGMRTRTERMLAGRRIVVVDIENVVGGAVTAAELVHWARQLIEATLALEEDDLVVVGTSGVSLLEVGCHWSHVRRVVRNGRDGADLELLQVLAENIAARFDRVVIVSGDHIFADVAAELAGSGVDVTVAAFSDTLSRRLALAAHHVVLFDTHGPRPVDAARAGVRTIARGAVA